MSWNSYLSSLLNETYGDFGYSEHQGETSTYYDPEQETSTSTVDQGKKVVSSMNPLYLVIGALLLIILMKK